MPLPELPGEITDRIISNVWPDIASLLSCSLVCSTWLPASRHHLFTELRSPSKKSYDLLVSRVLRCERMRPCLASVRSVELIEYRIGAQLWEPLRPEEKIGQFFLNDFIGHLPNMRTLRFQAEDWIQCPPRPNAFAGFSRFPSLRILELFDCKFPSFALLCQMLSALPALSSLMINDVYWPPCPVNRCAPVCAPGSDSNRGPKLETLYFAMEGVNHCAWEFMDWLVRTPSQSSIRELEVFRGCGPWIDPWSVVSAYTDLFASSVDYLRILYTNSGCAYPWKHSVMLTFRADTLSSLSDFTNLTHLSIDILDNMHGLPDWPGIVRSLQALQCSLNTLTIAYSYTSPPQFAHSHPRGRNIRSSDYEDGMEVLDAVFQQTRFQDLRKVTFSLRFVLTDEDVSLASRSAHTQDGLDQIIQRKLPKLTRQADTKGSVHVHIIPTYVGA